MTFSEIKPGMLFVCDDERNSYTYFVISVAQDDVGLYVVTYFETFTRGSRVDVITGRADHLFEQEPEVLIG